MFYIPYWSIIFDGAILQVDGAILQHYHSAWYVCNPLFPTSGYCREALVYEIVLGQSGMTRFLLKIGTYDQVPILKIGTSNRTKHIVLDKPMASFQTK